MRNLNFHCTSSLFYKATCSIILQKKISTRGTIKRTALLSKTRLSIKYSYTASQYSFTYFWFLPLSHYRVYFSGREQGDFCSISTLREIRRSFEVIYVPFYRH